MARTKHALMWRLLLAKNKHVLTCRLIMARNKPVLTWRLCYWQGASTCGHDVCLWQGASTCWHGVWFWQRTSICWHGVLYCQDNQHVLTWRLVQARQPQCLTAWRLHSLFGIWLIQAFTFHGFKHTREHQAEVVSVNAGSNLSEVVESTLFLNKDVLFDDPTCQILCKQIRNSTIRTWWRLKEPRR